MYRALYDLHLSKVDELDAPRAAALLELPQVRLQLEAIDRSEPQLVREDRAVRAAIDAHLGHEELFPEIVCRFLRLWCDTGGERALHQRWRDAIAPASNAAFGTHAEDLGGVRRQLQRRTGPASKALDLLATTLMGAHDETPRRLWLHGPGVEPPNGSGPRLVLLTGHHGSGLAHAAKRLVEQTPGAVLVRFDHAMTAEGARYQADERSGTPIPADREAANLYNRHRRALQWIARNALERAWEAVLQDLRRGHTVVFACSATIYHAKSGAISPTLGDAALIECLRDAQDEDAAVRAAIQHGVVVTLIDDVFDVFTRLSRLGEPFDPSDAYKTYFTRAVAMRTLLEWRHAEVLTAERTARLARWRHVILPAKSTVRTLQKIIEGRPIIYLSHPVRSIRAELGSPPTAEQARILQLAQLLEEGDVAVVAPMTIDELRLRRRFDDEDDEHIEGDELLPRWEPVAALQARGDELLWEPPTNEREARLFDQPFLDPGPPADGLDHRRLWRADTPDTLLMLHSELQRQLRWRVRLLLNQADGGLLVHRPYGGADGKMGTYLIDEVRLWDELKRHEQLPLRRNAAPDEDGARPLIVFHPVEDDHRRIVENLAHALPYGGLPHLFVRADCELDAVRAALRPWVVACGSIGRPLALNDIEMLIEIVPSLPGGQVLLPPGAGERNDALNRMKDTIEDIRSGLETYIHSPALVEIANALVIHAGDDAAAREIAGRFLAAQRSAMVKRRVSQRR